MNVDYTQSALASLRRDTPPPTRLGWADAIAASLQPEPIRNRDRPKIAFPKGVSDAATSRDVGAE